MKHEHFISLLKYGTDFAAGFLCCLLIVAGLIYQFYLRFVDDNQPDEDFGHPNHTPSSKPFLLVLGLLCCLSAISQDCYSPDNLITISGQVGVYKQALVPQIKIGVWRNVHSSGATLFIGYRDSTPIEHPADKDNHSGYTQYVGTPFAEIGYKQRITEWLFGHGFAGADKTGGYFGAEILYQSSWNSLIGLSYRKNIAGVTIYLRLN